jgi:hypothetical protein
VIPFFGITTRILCLGNGAIPDRHYKPKLQVVTRAASVFAGLECTNSRLVRNDARRSPGVIGTTGSAAAGPRHQPLVV